MNKFWVQVAVANSEIRKEKGERKVAPLLHSSFVTPPLAILHSPVAALHSPLAIRHSPKEKPSRFRERAPQVRL